jgi:hypothetical protein
VPNFWDLLAGRLDRVIVHVEERPIPAELLGGDYLGDAAFRARFQSWIDGLWKEKDERIEELLGGEGAQTRPRVTSRPGVSGVVSSRRSAVDGRHARSEDAAVDLLQGQLDLAGDEAEPG